MSICDVHLVLMPCRGAPTQRQVHQCGLQAGTKKNQPSVDVRINEAVSSVGAGNHLEATALKSVLQGKYFSPDQDPRAITFAEMEREHNMR